MLPLRLASVDQWSDQPGPAALMYRLAQTGLLAETELQDVARAVRAPQRLAIDESSLVEGSRPLGCMVVQDGLLCRYKMLANGRRQILAFLIPGDTFGLSAIFLGRSDHGVAALTPCQVATISPAKLHGLLVQSPNIGTALWHDMMIQDSIAREWMTSLGQRPAYERICHLLCEMRIRLAEVSLADGDRLPWPFSQAVIGDAVGLSIVHVNRTLQRLRAEGLIILRGSTLTILDWDRLQRSAGFNPSYLYLGRAPGGVESPLPAVHSEPNAAARLASKQL